MIAVTDNDCLGHNREVVEWARTESPIPHFFTEEPTPGIPAARNTCVRMAIEQNADALIFVDDDEIADIDWLPKLLEMWEKSGADAVTGPVLGILPPSSPAWARKSGVYDHSFRLPPGAELEAAHTGNVLINRALLEDLGPAFSMKLQFSGGSDSHYFLLARQRGYRIVWASDAIMREEVPPSRIKLSWVLKRGFRTGTGYTHIYYLLNQHAFMPAKILLASANIAGRGGVKLMLSPFVGWKYFISGIREVSRGVGCIAALFGVDCQEYISAHKKH